ncbi:MAG: hypothetical protein JJT94_03700 [Bernardetiaceae bacterium]|nr:hypothetical protein [Bernardetiaceae bacterium]
MKITIYHKISSVDLKKLLSSKHPKLKIRWSWIDTTDPLLITSKQVSVKIKNRQGALEITSAPNYAYFPFLIGTAIFALPTIMIGSFFFIAFIWLLYNKKAERFQSHILKTLRNEFAKK